LQTEVLIPQNSFHRKVTNFLKGINFLNILFKKINATRKVEIRFIERGADLKKSDVVLDIGSGDGYWTNYFSYKCKSITGIEPYEEHFEIAKKKYARTCSFKLENAENMSFEINSFDKIISVCVFEHMYNDGKAFSEMFRVLKPGGKLSATIDSLNSKFISEDFRAKHIKECYCAQMYSIDSITNKLMQAGFTNIKAHYIIGGRLGVFYEKSLERFGAIAYLLLLPFYPVILIMENKFKQSGYKIYVTAIKP
jgi:ubiquinone/menaquinone biosynthesis C-methylase UbiE